MKDVRRAFIVITFNWRNGQIKWLLKLSFELLWSQQLNSIYIELVFICFRTKGVSRVSIFWRFREQSGPNFSHKSHKNQNWWSSVGKMSSNFAKICKFTWVFGKNVVIFNQILVFLCRKWRKFEDRSSKNWGHFRFCRLAYAFEYTRTHSQDIHFEFSTSEAYGWFSKCIYSYVVCHVCL